MSNEVVFTGESIDIVTLGYWSVDDDTMGNGRSASYGGNVTAKGYLSRSNQRATGAFYTELRLNEDEQAELYALLNRVATRHAAALVPPADDA